MDADIIYSPASKLQEVVSLFLQSQICQTLPLALQQFRDPVWTKKKNILKTLIHDG